MSGENQLNWVYFSSIYHECRKYISSKPIGSLDEDIRWIIGMVMYISNPSRWPTYSSTPTSGDVNALSSLLKHFEKDLSTKSPELWKQFTILTYSLHDTENRKKMNMEVEKEKEVKIKEEPNSNPRKLKEGTAENPIVIEDDENESSDEEITTVVIKNKPLIEIMFSVNEPVKEEEEEKQKEKSSDDDDDADDDDDDDDDADDMHTPHEQILVGRRRVLYSSLFSNRTPKKSKKF